MDSLEGRFSSKCDCVQAYGSVLSCRVLYDHANRSKQVAFVQMETHQQAVHSVEALHGMQVRLHSNSIPCALPGLTKRSPTGRRQVDRWQETSPNTH